MDPLTHTLTGVIVAQGFLKKRIGPEAVPIMAIAANLPDIDTIVHLSGDVSAVLMRRTLGHSVILWPVWACLWAFIFKYKYRQLSWRTLFAMCLGGCALHVLFDLINSFGVVLLWPLSRWRPEFGIVFIVDLVLTGLLAAPLLISLPKKWRERRELWCRWAAASTALYLLFCGANRLWASHALSVEALRTGIEADFSYVFPEPFGPHRWHGVLLENDIYHNYLIHNFNGTIHPGGEIATDPDNFWAAAVRKTADGRRLSNFLKAPVWRILNNPENPLEGRLVETYDLRFHPQLVPRRRPSIFFQFIVHQDEKVKRLRRSHWPYIHLLKK